MVLSLPRMGERPMMTEARADLTCWLASDTSSWEGEGMGEPQGQWPRRLQLLRSPETQPTLAISIQGRLSVHGELQIHTCPACLEFNDPCSQQLSPQSQSSPDEEIQ